MIRTQVYLTERERMKLAALAEATGRNQSDLIREAVLDRAAGMWRDRTDLPDFRRVRRQWDRD